MPLGSTGTTAPCTSESAAAMRNGNRPTQATRTTARTRMAPAGRSGWPCPATRRCNTRRRPNRCPCRRTRRPSKSAWRSGPHWVSPLASSATWIRAHWATHPGPELQPDPPLSMINDMLRNFFPKLYENRKQARIAQQQHEAPCAFRKNSRNDSSNIRWQVRNDYCREHKPVYGNQIQNQRRARGKPSRDTQFAMVSRCGFFSPINSPLNQRSTYEGCSQEPCCQ